MYVNIKVMMLNLLKEVLQNIFFCIVTCNIKVIEGFHVVKLRTAIDWLNMEWKA